MNTEEEKEGIIRAVGALEGKYLEVLIGKIKEASNIDTTDLEPELSVAFRTGIESFGFQPLEVEMRRVPKKLLSCFMALTEKKLEDIEKCPLTKSSIIKLHNINKDIELLRSFTQEVFTETISEKEEITNSTWSETLENEDVKVTFIIEPKSSNLNKVLHGIGKKSQRAYLDFATDMGNKHNWFVSKKVNADV